MAKQPGEDFDLEGAKDYSRSMDELAAKAGSLENDFRNISDFVNKANKSIQDSSINTGKLRNLTSSVARSFSQYAELLEKAKSTGKSSNRIQELGNKVSRQAAEIAELQSRAALEYNKALQSRREIEEKLANATGDQAKNLQGQLKQAIKIEKNAKNLSSGLNDAAFEAQRFRDAVKEAAEASAEASKSVQIMAGIADLFETLGVGKLAPEFRKAADAIKKAKLEGKGFVKSLSAGLGELAKGFSKLSLVFLISQLKKFDTSLSGIANNLNVSREVALRLNDEMINLSKNSKGVLINSYELNQALTSINDLLGTVGTQFGNSAEFSNALLKTNVILTKRLGLTNLEAAGLSQYLIAANANAEKLTGQVGQFNAENFVQSLAGAVKVLNVAEETAIDFKDVLKDITTSSAATLVNAEKFPGGIRQAAINARKFGFSLSQVEKTAQGLLNFEQSIGSELEAELLIGRNLNLEQARLAALKGDTAKLAEELNKNVGTFADYQNYNVIQQQALADAVGMTTDELAKTLMQQEALGNVTNSFKESIAGLNANELAAYTEAIKNNTSLTAAEKERLLNLEARGATLEDQIKKELALIASLKEQASQTTDQVKKQELLGKAAKLRASLDNSQGAAQLAIQQENLSNQEKIQRAMLKVAEAVDRIFSRTGFMEGLDKAVDGFIKLANIADSIATGVIAITGAFAKMRLRKVFVEGFKSIGSIIDKIKSFFSGPSISNVVEGGVKEGTKDFAKSAGSQAAKAGGKTVTKAAGETVIKQAIKTGAVAAAKQSSSAVTKSLLKKIPVIGALASIPFAMYRANKGDWTGAGMEVLSGLVSTIPGVGTAGSVAIDAALFAKDINNAIKTPEPTSQEQGIVPNELKTKEDTKITGNSLDVEDFTIRSNPKDTLVMAGGTKFGEETNELLKELIQAVRSGGDVFLDGNKVGNSLMLATSKTT